MDRRRFLHTTTGAALVSSISSGAANVDWVKDYDPARSADWWDNTTRWVQLIMVENDPGHYDLGWWLDFLKRTKTNGFCLTAGGLTAYYPSKIPFHHISNWMKPGDDPFGDFVAGCRKLGITVVARTDSHTCLNDAGAAHPEWLNIDENGKPRRHFAMPDTRLITCAFGPYNFEFMTAVHREIALKYKVDGLFCNRWQDEARGMCYCENCKKLFRAYSGMDLPRGKDSPAAAKYREWGQARLVELWKLWDQTVREGNPNARYFSNTGLDLKTEALLAPTHLIERQNRTDQPLWDFGRAAKEARAVMPNKPLIALSGISSLVLERVSVTTDAEMTMWLIDAVTQGLQPWFLKNSAVVDDPRWTSHIERLYPWHAHNESYLRNTENLARVAMLFDAMGTGPGVQANPKGNAATGFYQALVEARIPFELVHLPTLSADSLKPFATLILPNVTNLSDGDCDVIRAFVGRGGNLVATFESSLYDETGKKRADFGLADLFQLSYQSTESSGLNAYMNVDQPTHPLLRDLAGVTRIVNTQDRVVAKSLLETERPVLTRIPPFPIIPMEEIYPRIPKTDIAEIFLRAPPGRGRVVYVPGDLDRSFSVSMLAEHGLLLRNMVDWATTEPRTVTAKGPGVLDISYWRQKNSVTVHLANMTNPMMLKAPLRELIPVGRQTVTIRLPSGVQPRHARLLVAGKDAPMTLNGQSVTVAVPAVVDHEVIAIDLERAETK